jgi:antitoxin ParD1/3/4
MARDRAVETWLQHEVAPAYDRMRADAERGVPVSQVQAALAAEHAKAKKRG